MTLVEFLRARLVEDAEPCEGSAEYGDCHDFSERRARDVEAKRRIIDEHTPSKPPGLALAERVCRTCTTAQKWDEKSNESNCITLRLLALPYADHKDYDEAWRP